MDQIYETDEKLLSDYHLLSEQNRERAANYLKNIARIEMMERGQETELEAHHLKDWTKEEAETLLKGFLGAIDAIKAGQKASIEKKSKPDSTGNCKAEKKAICCSFCGKSGKFVKRLIQGPGEVRICNECVDFCKTILDEQICEPATDPEAKRLNEEYIESVSAELLRYVHDGFVLGVELNPAEEPDDDTDRERRCGAYAVSQNYHPTLVFDTTLPESAIAALLERLHVKWMTEDHYVSDSGEVSQNLVLTRYYSTADVRPMAPNWKKAN